MAETVEKPKTTAEVDSYEEHKKLRQKPPTTPTESKPPAVESSVNSPAPEAGTPSEASPDSEPGKPSESAGVSETPLPQEKPKQPKRHDAEDRLKTLLEREKQRDQEIADLRKQLATRAAAPAEQPKPEPKPVSDEPNFDDYTAKAPPDESFGQTMARFNRDHFNWMQRKAQQETAANQAQARTQQLVAEAIAKYPDFLAVIGGQVDQQGGWRFASSGLSLPKPVMDLLMTVQNGRDVLYKLASDQDQLRQIASQDIAQQIAEVAYLTKTHSVPKANPPTEPTPEKPRTLTPPASRIPAPSLRVVGSEVAAPKSLAEAADMDDYRRLRKAQTKGRRAG